MLIDVHSHTISSGHAYSTINEMAKAGFNKGLEILAMTDHGPDMPGASHIYHFHNLRALPNIIEGVRILKGVEANIIDFDGGLDMPLEVLSELDLVIASFHFPCIKPMGLRESTRAALNLMDNKHVNIIGHPEDKRYALNLKDVVTKSIESRTLLEINNSSLLPTTFREGTRDGIVAILEECGKQGAMVVLGSDSHHSSNVGRFDEALELIDEISFPRELIINDKIEIFKEYIGLDN